MNDESGKKRPCPSRVVISLNPKAGRSSPGLRAASLKEHLEKRGYEAVLLTDLEEVTTTANRWHRDGELRVLVGVGGDGTAQELVNRTEPGVPVTLLSSGTANLLAKYFKLKRTPEKMSEIIDSGTLLQFDAGRANGRLFLVMLSCGFDAAVVDRVHAAREESYRRKLRKGAHISYLSYIKPIVDVVRSYKYPKLDFEYQEDPSQAFPEDATRQEARWGFVFNLNCYGWGLPLAPAAVGTDGWLDGCFFRGRSVLNGFVYTACAQCGSMHRFLPDCSIVRSVKMRISSWEDIPYQLDGDPGGRLPVEIEVVPNRVTFLVPRKTADRLAGPGTVTKKESR